PDSCSFRIPMICSSVKRLRFIRPYPSRSDSTFKWLHFRGARQVAQEKIETGARHPRGRQDWPLTGIFAQRGKKRPNRLGVTVCKIFTVEGMRLEVEGLDAINGTPVIDVKPVMREFLPREDIRQPVWVSELMAQYW
ncbi:TrmO family methyltransferase, partial [Gluconobacter oxydans]|uniref:TrmO family methyltransferase domain-containing protein n=1 Tax=Gluconobacter oxydans TaxID=442 RepID=UPI001CD9130C